MTAALLTAEQRDEVRRRYATGNYAISTLAAQYGVSESVIVRACRGIRRPPVSQRGPEGQLAWSTAYGQRPNQQRSAAAAQPRGEG